MRLRAGCDQHLKSRSPVPTDLRRVDRWFSRELGVPDLLSFPGTAVCWERNPPGWYYEAVKPNSLPAGAHRHGGQMAATHPEITPDLAAWIAEQPVFFVASAPLTASGHVNVSPRGLDTFRVIDPRRVAYLDLTGSGNETAAHIHENGRITVMFCAFSGAPRILRLYGRGQVILASDPAWPGHRTRFPERLPGARQIVVIDVHRIQTSCGFGVPLMSFSGQRDALLSWADRQGPDGLRAYWRSKNSVSLDGLPAPSPNNASGS